jgi:DNA-binding transcriptional regulator YdaS (Cro superfamily)
MHKMDQVGLPIRFEMIHNGYMRLRDYLHKHRITQAAFGQRMRPPVSQGKVNHWINGTRRVSLSEALQIEVLTDGEVTPIDLLPTSTPTTNDSQAPQRAEQGAANA